MFGGAFNSMTTKKCAALSSLRGHVMLADEKLNILYMNKSLTQLLQEAEGEIKKELPSFSMATLIGSNIDIFHKDPSHQRNMLARLEKPHAATIRVGGRVFDLMVVPIMRGGKKIGFSVEWADAKARLLNVDYAAQIAAIGRSQSVIEFAIDGTILGANENFLKAFGYTLDEVKGKHHRIFVDSATQGTRDYAELWASLSRGQYMAGEFRRIGKGGKEIWIQGSYNPILDEHGKVTKVVKFATDVTHRVHSVDAIGAALSALAEGDLESRLTQTLTPELDKLRSDFNRAIEKLQATLQRVGQRSHAIASGTEEIRSSSDELSKRSEQQAATLEETAAALNEITETVKRTSESAAHGSQIVNAATQDAEVSADVVRRAVDGMRAIEGSSTKISQIIGVIDEIAFQTNLLALNAGVEAARAGEAGRGFAVVASEVRALAQRSAEAAKEIKSLISASTEQVGRGVALVSETGAALQKIITQVAEISTVVISIAAAAREQASALQEINTAVNQMDQTTQQNAAMVSETTSSAHTLASETVGLNELVAQFRLGDGYSSESGRSRPAARDRGRGELRRIA